MSRPTEAELGHFEEVMGMLKIRWAGITAGARAKMKALNEDSAQREESMNEFKAAWWKFWWIAKS